tara:strand:+ start:29359 stop:29502 length:144 start_codon:yes stop_codon:yes gene_type:complete
LERSNVVELPKVSESDKQFIELERQRKIIKQQAKAIEEALSSFYVKE